MSPVVQPFTVTSWEEGGRQRDTYYRTEEVNVKFTTMTPWIDGRDADESLRVVGDCDWPWLLNNGRVALSSRQAVAGSYD